MSKVLKTVAELRKEATRLKIKGRSKLKTKKELVKRISHEGGNVYKTLNRKRKTSRKRRSVKRKGNKKLKFRITDEERVKIEKIFKKDKNDPEALCSICYEPLFPEGKEVSNKDIVGCVGAKNIPGWTCCSKTKKTGGCKNVYFHKKCLETWKESQKARHQEPSCPNCRAKQPPPPPLPSLTLTLANNLLGSIFFLSIT